MPVFELLQLSALRLQAASFSSSQLHSSLEFQESTEPSLDCVIGSTMAVLLMTTFPALELAQSETAMLVSLAGLSHRKSRELGDLL
jgi:hypothetical protein